MIDKITSDLDEILLTMKSAYQETRSARDSGLIDLTSIKKASESADAGGNGDCYSIGYLLTTMHHANSIIRIYREMEPMLDRLSTSQQLPSEMEIGLRVIKMMNHPLDSKTLNQDVNDYLIKQISRGRSARHGLRILVNKTLNNYSQTIDRINKIVSNLKTLKLNIQNNILYPVNISNNRVTSFGYNDASPMTYTSFKIAFDAFERLNLIEKFLISFAISIDVFKGSHDKTNLEFTLF